MLNFNKLVEQIKMMPEDGFIDRAERMATLAALRTAMHDAGKRENELAEKLEKNARLVLWPLALPIESFGKAKKLDSTLPPYTVIGVDGSQIMPSHHEVHASYLLNIGSAVISYGSQNSASLESIPYLYHSQEDLYPLINGRRFHIDELFISLERNLLELKTLAALACLTKEKQKTVVALLDGSLIPWSVEKLPEAYRKNYFARMEAALDQLKNMQVPVIGYISKSRASDIVNDLRVFVCPYDFSDCRKYCGTIDEENFPCSKIWPAADRQIFADMLAKAERSALFKSGVGAASAISSNQQICFCYLNVGSEIARLEFPLWLAADAQMCDQALAIVLSQADKGLGYPVSLAEAHNLAVIRAAEKERFFQLMANHMIDRGIKKISLSAKESRKRLGFV